jgi:hypothetical protein
MTAPHDPDTLIRTFLDEGQTELPDRAFDAVRRDIHETRQRVVIGPWRQPDMTILARVAIAAAFVVAAGFAWVNFGPPSQGGVGATPTPSPSSVTTPFPTHGAIRAFEALEPGTYRMNSVPEMSVTVPAGWTAYGGSAITKNDGTPTEAAIAPWPMLNTYVDPCRDHTVASPAPGPGVVDIAEALANQPGIEAGPPRDVTIDGYSGKVVELTVTTDITTCVGGKDGFWLWHDGEGHRFVQGTNEEDRLYILDVDGVRFSFAVAVQQATSAADRAELEAIIASIDIQP